MNMFFIGVGVRLDRELKKSSIRSGTRVFGKTSESIILNLILINIFHRTGKYRLNANSSSGVPNGLRTSSRQSKWA
jgi:hypothetical protein